MYNDNTLHVKVRENTSTCACACMHICRPIFPVHTRIYIPFFQKSCNTPRRPASHDHGSRVSSYERVMFRHTSVVFQMMNSTINRRKPSEIQHFVFLSYFRLYFV